MMQDYKKKIENYENAGKLLAVISVLAMLSGCATAANPTAMTVTSDATGPGFPQPLQHAMCVRAITGGEKTNALWVSKVDDAGFKTALTSSLTGAGLVAATDSGCTYPIDVNLLGLSQPAIGFDLTVTSHVNYKVYDAAGNPFLLATIDAPYTAKMGDALIAVERMRLANEGSIRTSIQMFFDKLRETPPK